MRTGARPRLFVSFSPAEGEAQSRDELLAHQAGVAGDPWDGRPSREAHFLRLLEERYPALERIAVEGTVNGR
jgi:Xaa-Pro aminopeptidase